MLQALGSKGVTASSFTLLIWKKHNVDASYADSKKWNVSFWVRDVREYVCSDVKRQSCYSQKGRLPL
jgi:hypothetical protein